MTSSVPAASRREAQAERGSSPIRPRSFGLYLLGAMMGSVVLAVPFGALTFFVGGGISSPPGSANAALGGVVAGLLGGLFVATIGSLFAKLADMAIRDADLRNAWRGVVVGGSAVIPHLLWLVPYPSLPGAVFVAVLWCLFGVSAVGRWRGGFARR